MRTYAAPPSGRMRRAPASERAVDLDRLVEAVDREGAEAGRVAPEMLDEGLRHQERLAELLVELGDPARQIDVAADHREVEPLSRADIAVGGVAVMQQIGRASCRERV